MKYFKFWVKENFKITINGDTETISVLSGSNTSKEEASKEAEKRSALIEKRISEGEQKEEYEAPIKEYVDKIIDDKNIVTVCRYGANILNTTQYTILDLYDYPINFMDMFKPIRKLPKKERIIAKFLERLQKSPELGSDFRIYETSKGVRVIGKKYIEPTNKGHERLMRKFAVDWLYIVLSIKQNCYRARITPKPYRMKAKTIKIKSPLDCETQQYIDWNKEYKNVSKRYSVVKYIKSIGTDFSSEPIIKLHDTVCNAHKNNTLA